ncbi:flagellar hook assembly protein FlgD [Alkalibacter mobilis]|uniref:flagellar hook assembly protein FlgD n=1 Tax=Alkalibacter mobilis TaxID=2787712 RepID=UPI0018A03ED2|nr:flagellar hook capping FlgD N-terminal domain-containing protein [Alkalibacter mobilis]MBF7096318.1 flagellar basal body rod modification protein [Alkalibacter mobilis]
MEVYGIGNQMTPQEGLKSNDSMDVQDFLKIMTAQLKNLDPMGESGADSSSYMTQMAQFTILEQLEGLTESLDNISTLTHQQLSFSLVGKTVKVNDVDETVTGEVEKIRFREGVVYPVVNGKEYSMGMISEVGEEQDVL